MALETGVVPFVCIIPKWTRRFLYSNEYYISWTVQVLQFLRKFLHWLEVFLKSLPNILCLISTSTLSWMDKIDNWFYLVLLLRLTSANNHRHSSTTMITANTQVNLSSHSPLTRSSTTGSGPESSRGKSLMLHNLHLQHMSCRGLIKSGIWIYTIKIFGSTTSKLVCRV